MIDVYEQVRDLLTFNSEDDFYFLQIMRRKKDNNPGVGKNNNIIKNYYINSLEYLDRKYGEIKELCNFFNARAMLRLNKRSYRKTGLRTIQKIADNIVNENYDKIKKAYDRCVGESHNAKEKKWIVDIDDIDIKTSGKQIKEVSDFVELALGGTIYRLLETKSGIHLITSPFNTMTFKSVCLYDIHKDNPINLYIPDNKEEGNEKNSKI